MSIFHFRRNPARIFLDVHGSHTDKRVIQRLKELKTDVSFIPAGMTKEFQMNGIFLRTLGETEISSQMLYFLQIYRWITCSSANCGPNLAYGCATRPNFVWPSLVIANVLRTTSSCSLSLSLWRKSNGIGTLLNRSRCLFVTLPEKNVYFNIFCLPSGAPDLQIRKL